MAITQLPDPPSRSDPSTFASKGDAFLAALQQFVNEANALLAQCEQNATIALTFGEVKTQLENYDSQKSEDNLGFITTKGKVIGKAGGAMQLVPVSDAYPPEVTNALGNTQLILSRSALLYGTRSSTNLVITTTGASAIITVTADSILLRDASGNCMLDEAVSGTCSITSSGAGGLDTGSPAYSTWYYVYRIAKADGTKNFLLSLSETSPTLPSGYTFFTRLGSVRTQSTTNYYPLHTKQMGRIVQYVPAASGNVTAWPIAASGNNGGSVSITSFVPPTASVINLICNATAASYGYMQVGPSIYSVALVTSNSNTAQAYNLKFILETTSIYVNSQANTRINVMGWEENI